jgi:hypothetical protein
MGYTHYWERNPNRTASFEEISYMSLPTWQKESSRPLKSKASRLPTGSARSLVAGLLTTPRYRSTDLTMSDTKPLRGTKSAPKLRSGGTRAKILTGSAIFVRRIGTRTMLLSPLC